MLLGISIIPQTSEELLYFITKRIPYLCGFWRFANAYYGSVEERSGAQADLPNPYLYRGEYTDALTGNQYLRARYYRPSTGSFLTRDTYPGDQTEPVSLNRYTYAGNDPVNLEDPSGHGWLKKKVQQAKQAVKKTVSKAKKAVKSAAKKVEKAVKKTAAKVVKKAKTVVKKAVKKAKTVVRKAKKTVKKVVRKAAKKVKSSKLYKKAKKTATKIKKKVCTTAKRIQKATVSFVKNVDWKKVVAGTVAAVAIAGAVALTGGAAMPVLIGAAQAGGMGALVSGAAAAAQGGSIADIAKAASDGFLWGAIGGAIAGGTAVMFNQAATTGSSLAGNYAVRQAVDVGTDTVLDTVQAVARGEDVNAKTIGRDLLTNTLMAGAQVAGGSGKNGIVDTGTGGGNKPANMSPEGAGRKGAFKEAKRKNGIPVSEQPKKVSTNVDKRGNPQPGRNYEFDNKVSIRDDAAGHIYPDNPTQNRGPHFNDPAGNHYDY